MMYTATITSKRQITLPVAIFRDFELVVGQKLVIEKVNNQILINPAIQSIYKLMGSVKRPKKYKGVDIDVMIEKAKGDYFAEKYKHLNE